METVTIGKDWTLFLDRDGVINKRLPGRYVSSISDFCFLDGVIESLAKWGGSFGRIVVVTNQQGIGKGIVTVEELAVVHQYMVEELAKQGVIIDQIYYCSALATEDNPCRKPDIGMALLAQKDFPEIDFKKSVMIGDSVSDMKFAERLSMRRILVLGKVEELEQQKKLKVDMSIRSMKELNF